MTGPEDTEDHVSNEWGLIECPAVECCPPNVDVEIGERLDESCPGVIDA